MTVVVHEFLQLFRGKVAAFQIGHFLLDIDGGHIGCGGGRVSGVSLAAAVAAAAVSDPVAVGGDGRHRSHGRR